MYNRYSLLLFFLLSGTALLAGPIQDMYRSATEEISKMRAQGYELQQMMCEGLELEESRKTISALLYAEYEYYVWIQTTSELEEFEVKITNDDDEDILSEEYSNAHAERLDPLPYGRYVIGVRGTNYYEDKRIGYFAMILLRRPRSGSTPDQSGRGTLPTPGPAPAPAPGPDESNWTRDCSFSQLYRLKRNIRESRIEEPGNSTEYRTYEAKLKIDKDLREVTIKPDRGSTYTYQVVGKRCHVSTGEKRLELEDEQRTRYYMIFDFNRGTISLQPKGSNRQVIYRE